ncbi:hypothetical protein [Clostridium sp. ZBS18]|uniref:hypothetical protein n=1 Tax=Clostridium sp. ZBS18 TaxID=2949967 RepID=UPI00207934D2|nr:hypothetical protein [Clostridium sp. ZBS18]
MDINSIFKQSEANKMINKVFENSNYYKDMTEISYMGYIQGYVACFGNFKEHEREKVISLLKEVYDDWKLEGKDTKYLEDILRLYDDTYKRWKL